MRTPGASPFTTLHVAILVTTLFRCTDQQQPAEKLPNQGIWRGVLTAKGSNFEKVAPRHPTNASASSATIQAVEEAALAPKPIFQPHFKHPMGAATRRGVKRTPATNIYNDLCILDSEEKHVVRVGTGPQDRWTASRRVHVYNQRSGGLSPFRVALQFGGEANSGTGDVEVLAHSGPPPLPLEEGVVAFFLGTTCEANFDHFIGDSLIYLHASAASSGVIPADIGSTKIIRERAVNSTALFWNRDLMSYDRKMGPMGGFCHNPELFEEILSTYGLNQRPTAYWKISRPMCFKHAVFVGGSGSVTPREALTYAAGQMGIEKCSAVPLVTIFNRGGTRRILNIDEVASHVRTMFDNVSATVNVLEMEGTSIAQQLSAVRCSGLVIGVHGAAMAWSAAMHPRAALVEISWNGWEFYYSCPAQARGKFHGVCHGSSKYGVQRAAFFRVEASRTSLRPQHQQLTRTTKAPREKFLSASLDVKRLGDIIRALFQGSWPPKLASWGTRQQ